MTARPIRFLSVDDVLCMHRLAIVDQGGDASIRDRGLLESALAMPQQQFGGEYLHNGIPAMAGAYAFHIAKNHPFVDGNKRAATAAIIQFLSDNGWGFDATADEAEPVILRLAAGDLSKSELTDWVRSKTHEKPSMELRDFFRRIDPASHFEHLTAVTVHPSTPEYRASLVEAAAAIPLLVHLRARLEAFLAENKKDEALLFAGHAMMLLAVHRVAEDMGYEW